jgi:hypothetical protein
MGADDQWRHGHTSAENGKGGERRDADHGTGRVRIGKWPQQNAATRFEFGARGPSPGRPESAGDGWAAQRGLEDGDYGARYLRALDARLAARFRVR